MYTFWKCLEEHQSLLHKGIWLNFTHTFLHMWSASENMEVSYFHPRAKKNCTKIFPTTNFIPPQSTFLDYWTTSCSSFQALNLYILDYLGSRYIQLDCQINSLRAKHSTVFFQICWICTTIFSFCLFPRWLCAHTHIRWY